MKHHHTVRRRHFHLFLFLIGCVAGVLIARHAIVGVLANWTLHHFYPEERGSITGFSSAKWEGNILSISGVEIETPSESIQIEKIELALGFKPRLWVIRPHWTIKVDVQEQNDKKSRSLFFLLRLLHLAVVDGRCAILPLADQFTEKRFAFSLESLEHNVPNMHLACFKDSEASETPFLDSYFTLYKEHIEIEAYSKAASVQELMGVAHLFFPRFCEQLETSKGICDADVRLIVDHHGRLLTLQGALSATNFSLKNAVEGWQMGADTIEMAIHSNKNAAAKLLETEAAISGGTFYLTGRENEYQFVDLGGYFSWLKEADPKFHLEGRLLLGKNSESVLIDGVGKVDEQEGLRIDSLFSLGEKEQLIASGDISIIDKLEGVVVDVHLQYADLPFLKHLGDVIGWTSPSLFTVQGGAVQGAGLFKFKQGVLVKAELAPLLLTDANFENQTDFRAKSLTLSVEGKWHVLPDIGWQIKRFNGVVQSGDIDFKQWKNLTFKNLSGECHIERGQIEQSTFKAQVQDVPLEFTISGDWQKPSGILFASTNWQNFTQVMACMGLPVLKENSLKEELEVACEIKPLPHGYATHLQILTGSEGKIKSKVIIADKEIQSGTIEASNFPVSLLFSSLSKEVQGKGLIDIEGNFDSKGGEARFSFSEMELESSKWTFDTKVKTQGEIAWGASDKELKIQLPLQSVHCYFKEPRLSLENTSALLVANSHSIEAKEIETSCGGFTFKGEAILKGEIIKVVSKEIRGNLLDLQPILENYPSLPQIPRGTQGKFTIKDHDLRIEWPSGALFVRAHLEDVFLPFGVIGALDRVTTKILYDSQKGVLSIGAIEGDLRLTKATPLRMEFQPIELHIKEREFIGSVSGAVKNETCTFLGTSGQLKISPGETTFETEPFKSQLFGSPVEKAVVQIKDDGIGVSLSGTCELEKLLSSIQQLQQQDTAAAMPISLKGRCAYQIAWDSKAMRWQGNLQSNQLLIAGKKVENILIRASKDLQRFCIEEAKWNDCTAYIEMSQNRSADPSFFYRFNSPSLNSSGEGTLNLPKRILNISPRLEFIGMGQSIMFKPQGAISIDFSRNGEVMAQGVKWEEVMSRSLIEIPKIHWGYGQGQLEIEKANFKISSLIAKKWFPSLRSSSGWFEGNGRCLKTSTGYEVEGTLRDGEYGWAESLFKGKAIQFRWVPNTLLVGAKTQLEEHLLSGTFQLDLRDKIAMLKVQEQGRDSALSALFRLREKGVPIIEKISGECLGIRADFKNTQTETCSLVGKIDIDFNELHAVLPAKSRQSLLKFKLGKGFSFEGEIQIPNLIAWKAHGTFRGKECILFDTLFDHLESNVAFSAKRQVFKQVVLKDAGISLTIPQMKIENTSEGVWTLDCPFLQVKDLQPSRLRKLKEKEKPLKPFIIRHFTLSDIFGELNDPEKIQGNCFLQFTNIGKKETNFLDIPLNMLKDLGLEPSLLVPLQGELIGHLEKGKLFFTDLKGAYSEGRRTHFILANHGEGSYIDFDGKLHIDLIMKQAVMLKIAESLTLGIRGNLDKPRYLLLP